MRLTTLVALVVDRWRHDSCAKVAFFLVSPMWRCKSGGQNRRPMDLQPSNITTRLGMANQWNVCHEWHEAAVAEWYRYRTVACFVTGSSPVPLKTRRVGQRCTLNLSRAETSSRWCGVVVRRGGCQLRCRPRHLTMVQNVVRRQKPSCS
ncbi:uncharacterized protein TNCV_2313481 [Trichonephila clavipes]|nr:uncharacterized protein TNCV_2313481 [Trichonephila clavipes]